MIFYTIVLFLLLFFGLRYLKSFAIGETSPWTMPAALAVKTLVALFFLYLYTFILGEGKLGEDAGLFIRESKILHDVFYDSPGAYFKFLTGIGESQELIEHHLAETTRWDIGTQSMMNDNKNILRLHSLIHFFSLGIPAIHAMILVVLGLVGIKQLFLAVESYTKMPKTYLFWAIVLLPGLLFWSSSVLKEPLMLLGMGLLLRGVFRSDSTAKRILFGVLGTVILLGFKSYVFFSMLPMLAFIACAFALPKFRIIGSLLVLSVLTSVAFLSIPSLQERAIKTVSRRQFDFTNVARGGLHVYTGEKFYYFEPRQIDCFEFEDDSVRLKRDTYAQILKLGQLDKPERIDVKADSSKWFIYFHNQPSNGFIQLTPINHSYARLFGSIPEALGNALFRPLPGDPGSAFNYVAIVETLAVFAFLFWAIYHRRKLTKKEQIYVAGLVLFGLILALMIGWTTSVLGAIARYRIPVYLVLILVGAIVYRGTQTNRNEEISTE